MHSVDLDESFPTSIYLQNLASIPKHFLKLAAFASQPVSVFPACFQISLNPNLQFSIFKFPISWEFENWEFSNSRIPVLFPVSEPSPTDPSDLLRSLTIGSDPSDPFRSLRSLRSLRSVPIPLIRVISSTHTLPVSVLSLPSHANHCEDKFHQRRALGDARRNLYSRERALKF